MGKEATRVRRRERKNIASGIVHVNSTFNNTLITFTDAQGNVVCWYAPEPWVSRVRVNRPPMPRKWPLKMPAARRRNSV